MSNNTRVPVKFNEGRVLFHLANVYPKLISVILEIVQNALDKDVRATRIWININYKTRYLAVRDNGSGVTPEKFNAALASVADPARKGEGSLGQFGIGLISPLGKCREFRFVSCPDPHRDQFQEWGFVCKEILEQKEGLRISLRNRTDLIFDADGRPAQGRQTVQWRSEMSLTDFTRDKFISDVPIDDLIGSIQDRYATTMRQNGTVISLEITDEKGNTTRRPNVTAPKFQGRALPVQVFTNADAGRTTFRLFVVTKKKGGKAGRVVMGVEGNDFRFPFHYFTRSASEHLSPEVITAFASGLFEGEIVSEKGRLHANRKAIEKDDAFIGLCCAIEEWYERFGSECFGQLKHTREEERHQELGLRSMEVIKHILNDPAHESLRRAIDSFGKGTVGAGKTSVGENVVGQQDKSALSVGGKQGLSQQNNNGVQHDQAKSAERKPHTPLTVTGPHGTPRKVVKSSGFGLQFAHEPMEGSPDLWRLDVEEGVLTFNIRHTIWRMCDVNDTNIMRLQECVAMQALTLHIMPENQRLFQRHFLDEFNHSLASWILNGDKLRTHTKNKKAVSDNKKSS